jgi:hypothetical protein
MDGDELPDRWAEWQMAKAMRRVEQFDRALIEELCGCGCRESWCAICGMAMTQPPPTTQGKTTIRFGANTPEGE